MRYLGALSNKANPVLVSMHDAREAVEDRRSRFRSFAAGVNHGRFKRNS